MEGEPVEETLTDVATSPAQAVETDAVVSAGEEIAEIDEDAVNTVAGVEIAEVDYPPQTPIPGSDTAEVAETPEIAPTEDAQVETADAVAVPEVEFSDAPSVEEDVTVADSGEPAPPRVMIAGSEGITIVQQGGHGPVALESVTLDAITYDAIGEVQLSGRGAGAGNVRVYLDNNPIRTAAITESGQWRTGLPEVESGIYTLRVDELREDGTVTSRIETPFKREDADQLAAVAAEVAGDSGKAPVQAVTVQPGSTLWAIAKENYGEGTLYVRVFEANRDQIRDPDWIYPGQVFAIPGE
ncbi:MAG: LysM peptidoglycan-binding domain-containing protein [Rhodobacteraceae bacterium]|nr:LysM peptidoglycan-binding domain-containing protein [Paracoccaceae bacterium]